MISTAGYEFDRGKLFNLCAVFSAVCRHDVHGRNIARLN